MTQSDTDNKWLAERIRNRQDLEKLTRDSAGDWMIEDFHDIPMGWSAILMNDERKITIWSHRSEIEAEEFADGQWKRSEILEHGWTLKDTDIQIVTKVLANALQK